MATILLTWELGGGLGHLVNLEPLAKGLSQRGHRVFAALRDLSRAKTLFAGMDVSYLQAAIKTRRDANRFDPPRTFPHILNNSGFGSASELRTLTDAWRNLYDYVRPDLIVFDHSPTALLAARGSDTRRALIGTGFFCPLNEYPLPDLRPWLPEDNERLRRSEDAVLENANRVLEGLGQPPLERIAQLYYQVDENFLVTFRELDNYPRRQGAEYWGAWPNVGGKAPAWPEGDGKRVYAYLKSFAGLPRLLALLNELRFPTIIYVDGIAAKVQERFRSPTLRFENERLDLQQVGRECDLAILNGTHGTTVSMLLAGKPMLQLPMYLEQGMNAAAVGRIGAGLTAAPVKPEQIAIRLMTLLHDQRYAEAARRFAANYAEFDPQRQIEKMLERVDGLLG